MKSHLAQLSEACLGFMILEKLTFSFNKWHWHACILPHGTKSQTMIYMVGEVSYRVEHKPCHVYSPDLEDWYQRKLWCCGVSPLLNLDEKAVLSGKIVHVWDTAYTHMAVLSAEIVPYETLATRIHTRTRAHTHSEIVHVWDPAP